MAFDIPTSFRTARGGDPESRIVISRFRVRGLCPRPGL